MAYLATVYRILIAGPSDVWAARQAIVKELEAWNNRHSEEYGIVLRSVTWETNSFPEMGDDPQGILNRQLVDVCDASICVFGARMGTATPRALSGTAEEIDRIQRAGKPVMLYFSRSQIPRNFDREQLDALDQFKSEVRQRGLVRAYGSVNSLRELVATHLVSLVNIWRHHGPLVVNPKPRENEQEKMGLHVVKSPLVGNVYLNLGPGEAQFIEVGEYVEHGQIIAVIEAMKIMNEILSDSSGIVRQILVTNGEGVEYGSPLILLDKHAQRRSPSNEE